MKKKYFKKIFLIIIYFHKIHNIFEFAGNQIHGFNFPLLNQISIDILNQYIYVCSKNNIPQENNNSNSFNISVYDNKNSNGIIKRFYPIITKNAIVNGVTESNPLYQKGISNFDLALGLAFEPKFYPLIIPSDSNQVFLINNLDIYSNKQNFLIATDNLLDINEQHGTIKNLASAQNQFIVSVIPLNSVFDNNTGAIFRRYSIHEKIVPIPGSSNYLTGVALKELQSFTIDNKNEYFLMKNDINFNIASSKLLASGSAILNTFYIGICGSGENGIKNIIMPEKSLLSKDKENLINGNKIFATNQSNIPLFNESINILVNSTGLPYLIIQGGRNDLLSANNTVYALPLINSIKNENTIGTLANINTEPNPIFSDTAPYLFINNTISTTPEVSSDLYNWNDQNAIVGCIPFIPYNKNINFTDTLYNTINFPFKINHIEAYKDTIFASTSYQNIDNKYIGGIFYSQGLLNENGKISTWTLWQRKDIIGNIQTASYMPLFGSNIGIIENMPGMIFGTQISANGPFPSQNTLDNTPCKNSGIQKIIDIPFMHPAIGFNSIDKNGLSPSYAISVGWNTVIIQQTANNSGMSPLLNMNYIYCENGNTSSILSKNNNTNAIIFQGGELENAGALFTAALGYNELDCWFIVAGENGIYILSDIKGIGSGPSYLQENFIGITENQSWQKLSDIKQVRKIISNNNFLYIITNKSIYKIKLSANNITKKENAEYFELLSIFDLPGASEFSSFSDGLFSENKCILATSLGLFVNSINSSIKNDLKLSMHEIILPEKWDSAPVYLYPITKTGYADSWAIGDENTLSGNIYLTTTSISKHYSHIYRLATYGTTSLANKKETVLLIHNYFIKDRSTYYYNPGIELLSASSDGASIFSHGVFGTSYLYRSFISILNPLIKHGIIGLKNEYNFFELASKSNMYFGFPTYISGIGIWAFTSQNGVQAIC